MTFEINRSVEVPVKDNQKYRRGFTMVELSVVIIIFMIIIFMVGPRVITVNRKMVMQQDLNKFVHTLSMMVDESILRGKSYVIVIDIADGYYTVYFDKEYELYEDAESVLPEGKLNEWYIENIAFDDHAKDLDGIIKLRATSTGWVNGVTITFADFLNEKLRYLQCERLTNRVGIVNHPVDLIAPQKSVSMTESL
jgi:prepilin-type N-terminal cleavage/methylation domain-containing protein